jgi:hypothetical protein
MTAAKILGALWIPLAIFLLTATLVFATAEAYTGKSSLPIVEFIVAIALFLFLFVVEGAEVAAVALLDKDPDQVKEPRIRDTVVRLQKHHEAFLTGRQVVEVSLIVILTFLSNSLFRADILPGSSRMGALASPEAITFALAFGLSSLLVFWFAQLLAKLFAEERPLDVLDWLPTRLLVGMTLQFEKLQFGAPGLRTWKRLKTRLRPYEKVLLPSRELLYQLSAQLHYGRGYDDMEIQIVIGSVGEATVTSRSLLQAFGKGFDGTTEEHTWEAAIDPSSLALEFITEPQGCGYHSVTEPTPKEATFDGRVVPGGKVTWDIRYQGDIPKGEKLEYKLRFSTTAGACKTTLGAEDFYIYYFRHPTRMARFEIKPVQGAPFIFRDGDCEVKMSDDAEVNLSERERVVKIEFREGGFVFRLVHPCEGTEFKFKWRVAPRNPARSVAT